MNTVRKSLAAALTGVVTWGVTAQTNGIDGAEWWGLASVLVGAFLVWLTPNEPVDEGLAAALREGMPEPDDIATTGAPDGD